jgi:hypothetical protein
VRPAPPAANRRARAAWASLAELKAVYVLGDGADGCRGSKGELGTVECNEAAPFDNALSCACQARILDYFSFPIAPCIRQGVFVQEKTLGNYSYQEWFFYFEFAPLSSYRMGNKIRSATAHTRLQALQGDSFPFAGGLPLLMIQQSKTVCGVCACGRFSRR